MVLNNKILTLLGFAAKAGKLSYGFEACVSSIKSGQSHLALVASDISAKSCKEVRFYADKCVVKHILLEGIDIKQMSDAVGKKCGIVSVNDKGFADALAKVLV